MTQDNQPINGYIDEYLDYYCGLSQAPGFAVLLKGKWGCGKTWFINRYSEKLKQQNRKCLYVSLNGVTSFSEIEEAFLQQQIPFLASKPIAIGRNLITQVLKNSLKLDVNEDATLNLTTPSMKLTELFTNLDQSILMFDDLERCQINLSNILGYINNFIEHKGLKVIIAADEEKLEKNDSYKTIKEKLIGSEFAISLDFNRALENFTAKLKNPDIREFVSENADLIQNVYTKAQYENLRTLNKTLLDFERIFESLPEKVRIKPVILQDILNFLLVLSIEIKSGILSPKDINKLEGEYISSLSNQVSSYPLSNSDAHIKETTDSPHLIFQKYNFINFYTPFPSLIWWQAFFDKGILDAQELDKSLKSSKYFEDETTPNWVKLWYSYSLSDEEFEKLLPQVESEYANRDFDDPGVVKHITGIFLNFSDAGLVHKSKEEVLNDSKSYIDCLKARDQSKLASYFFSTGDILLGGYLGLGFQGAKLEEFNEFCIYLEKAQESVKNDNLPNVGQELLAVIQSDAWKFREMICLDGSPYRVTISQQYHKIPVLKHIKESDFVEKLLSLEFEYKDVVCRSLIKRYEIEIFNKELFEELDWLKSVRSLLQEEIVRRQGKISGYALKKYIEPSLNEAISKLEGKTD
jgi:hypothetical protein